MTVLMINSGDLDAGDTTDVGEKWGFLNEISITTSFNVGGRLCWRVGQRIDSAVRYDFKPGEEDATVIVGWRGRFDAIGADAGDTSQETILQLFTDDAATPQLSLVQRGLYTVALLRGGQGSPEIDRTATNAAIEDIWYYFEFKATIDDTVGAYELRIDGVDVMSDTGVDTKAGGTSSDVDAVGWGSHRNRYHFIRDCVLMNTAGSDNNDFIGAITAEGQVIASDGNYQTWLPLGGGTHFTEVDESDPDGDTSYVRTLSTDNRESFGVSPFVNLTQTLVAAEVQSFGRYVEAPMDTALFIRRGSDNDDPPFATPIGGYGGTGHYVYENDPFGSTDWLVSTLNNTEFGVRT